MIGTLPQVVIGGSRDTDAAGLSYALEPGRDVDAISKNVVRFDDYISNVDADPKNEASIFRLPGHEIPNAALKMHTRPDGLDGAGEFGQKPVSGVLDDAPAIFGDCRVDRCVSRAVRRLCVPSSSACISRE